MEKYTKLSKDVLYDLYINKKMSTNTVAEELQLSNLTIRKALKYNKIQIRGSGPVDGFKFTKEHKAKISKALKGTKNGVNPMTGKSYRWDKREVKCDQCKKKFLVPPFRLKNKHHFCSEKCYFKYRSIYWVGKNSPKYNQQIVQCVQCKKEISLPQNRLINGVKNHFCNNKCRNKWLKEHRLSSEEKKQNRQKNNSKVVAEAIERYGNKCNCCNEKNKSFLVFDHINGGGAKFRRKTGMTGQVRMAYWLRKNNWPTDIQVLCCNCNHAKDDRSKCPCKQNQNAIQC